MKIPQDKGFIALVSVIIISSILLILAVTLNFSGFFGRLNTYNGEIKAESEALASSCIDHAILKLAEDDTFDGDVSVSVGTESCYIYTLNFSGNDATFVTRGIKNGAHTFYKTTMDTDTFKIASFLECPTLSTCP